MIWPIVWTVLEIERFDEHREIVGVGVYVVAASGPVDSIVYMREEILHLLHPLAVLFELALVWLFNLTGDPHVFMGHFTASFLYFGACRLATTPRPAPCKAGRWTLSASAGSP